ncbi:MAG TPA: histidine kinase [Rhodanobacteraceae bacterium]|nr:histidine kinase [Rhodanobacteraceae bacterium]
MHAFTAPVRPRGLALLLAWQRVVFTLGFAFVISLPLAIGWKSGFVSLEVRVLTIAFVAMLVFGLFEQWPKRLPRWLARWALQVVGVMLAMPISTFAIYVLSTAPGAPPFWQVPDRMTGFSGLTALGIFIAPWIALAALVRQKDALARHQALAFELERSEFERQALDARLHLLQAQVAPHFLFNTLANVQALVDAGSPQASAVLRNLVAYLRAAVPRLREPVTTLKQELELVTAYLELMHMRMPDRLQFALHFEEADLALRCPPLTLLTLVENAVRHGIDPGEEGGRIDIHVERQGERCRVRVVDTGVGLGASNGGLGTGLSTLRERLQLIFGDAAELRVRANAPRGVIAEIEIPAQEGMR